MWLSSNWQKSYWEELNWNGATDGGGGPAFTDGIVIGQRICVGITTGVGGADLVIWDRITSRLEVP
jgi:hypothetical protein